MQSFIGDLLRRRPEMSSPWGGENLLTDATAAVLNRVPELAAEIVRLLVGERPEQVEALTQRRYGSNIIDLVLREGETDLVWIEVKDRARQSGNQLENYLTYIRERGLGTAVVYLPRRGGGRSNVDGVLDENWAAVGVRIDEWLRDRGPAAGTPEHFLVHDYLTYLKERGMALNDPVPRDLDRVAAEFQTTYAALAELNTAANEMMVQDRGWRDLDGSGWTSLGARPSRIGDWPAAWWQAFEARPDGAFAGCDFEWVLLGFTPDHPPGAPRIAAGLIWRQHRGIPGPLEDEAWIAEIAALRPDDGYGEFKLVMTSRLYRELPLAVLTEHATLNEQAQLLTEFADTTFRLLEGHPPVARTV